MIENGWPEPDWSILEDHRAELPGFPLGCLPAPTSAWVTRAARGAGVTPAHVAVPGLGVAGGLVGCARKVQASASWSEPLAMWTGIVGYSGSGKTPAIEVLKCTLTAIENHWQANIAELARQHEERATLAKAQQRQWRKQVQQALAEGLVPPPMPLAAQFPGPFTPPRLFITNTTVEQIAPLLAARPRGLIAIIDELSGLFLNMHRYGGRDEPFWLSSWNGGREVVERRSGSWAVEHLLVGFVGGFQPDALARCFRGDQLGMYARFLFRAGPRFRPRIEPARRPVGGRIWSAPPEQNSADADGADGLRGFPAGQRCRPQAARGSRAGVSEQSSGACPAARWEPAIPQLGLPRRRRARPGRRGVHGTGSPAVGWVFSAARLCVLAAHRDH